MSKSQLKRFKTQQRPSPRTDAEQKRILEFDYVPLNEAWADFARSLEWEIEDLKQQLYYEQCKGL